MSTLNQLISKVKEDLASLETTDETHQISKHFSNTISHLQLRSQEAAASGEQTFEGLTI